jgi:hypothetical protein
MKTLWFVNIHIAAVLACFSHSFKITGITAIGGARLCNPVPLFSSLLFRGAVPKKASFASMQLAAAVQLLCESTEPPCAHLSQGCQEGNQCALVTNGMITLNEIEN